MEKERDLTRQIVLLPDIRIKQKIIVKNGRKPIRMQDTIMTLMIFVKKQRQQMDL